MNKQPSLKQTFFLSKQMLSKEAVRQSIISSPLCHENFYLLILSAWLICIGLDADSETIIIGGMIITPLLGSLSAIAFGTVCHDKQLLSHGLYNFFGGTLIIIFFSTLYFALVPALLPNLTIISSVSLSYEDYLVSIAGGMTLAFGFFYDQRIMPFIAVSIATTLVPPICVIGYTASQFYTSLLFPACRIFFINSFLIFLSCLLCFTIGFKLSKKQN